MSDNHDLVVKNGTIVLSENSYLKAILFAAFGCATAGGWLIVDLILPEPWGDVALDIAMAVINGYLGWQAGYSIRKWKKRADAAKGNRFLLAIPLAIIGCATAVFWFAFDLFTPEPWGDYALYAVMGVVNGYIGWQIGRTIRKWKERANTAVVGHSSES